ncbi:SGNH/GDSL hydrolase family protein [Algicola sagamiensis]|uniref:SGNH/GDSL hydrolase family protein n=1 Tax=Algicola sagamiensis TaxID=163869 RepID=UPI0003A978AD|nr:SGNH/GDSL hydrolase family protein [Algicola sagamiensis]
MNMVHFGDSISDSGVKHAMTGMLNEQSQDHIGIRALEPNFQGRFSNGLTWVDYLQVSFNHQLGQPAMLSRQWEVTLNIGDQNRKFSTQLQSLTGHNWSIGGAMTGDGYFHDFDTQNGATYIEGGELMPNLGQQIDDYLALYSSFQGVDWITIQGGINNLWYSTYGSLSQTSQEAAEQYLENIRKMLAHDAKHILVMNLPDISISPAFSPVKEKAGAYVASFNQTLNMGLIQIQLDYPDAQVAVLDAYQIIQAIDEAVQVNGIYENRRLRLHIMDSRNAAWNNRTGEIAQSPNDYLFWDSIHPTTAVHRLLAEQARKQMTPWRQKGMD